MMMRIAIDATAAVSGGRVYLTRLLAEVSGLAAGHQVVVFHTDDFKAVAASLASPHLEFRRVKLPASGVGGRLGPSVLKMLWRLFVFPLHLHRMQPDLVFSNAGVGPGWRPKGTKLIVCLHNAMPLHDELVRAESSRVRRLRLVWLKRMMGRTLRDCDGVIVFSEDLRRRVIAAFAGLKCEPAVVYHGIEWGEAERAEAPNPGRLTALGLRQPYLLYISHFHRYKNFLNLLEAFALLAPEQPDLSLALVGAPADAGYWEEINRAISRLGIEARVKLIPGCPREGLKDIYRAALGFVYPSLAENCPFALLEAMAFGLPIAAARASAIPEIGGEAAIYFDPQDPADLASAMRKMIRDAAWREELGRRAAARACGFSWTKSARQTWRVFEQVAGAEAGGQKLKTGMEITPTVRGS